MASGREKLTGNVEDVVVDGDPDRVLVVLAVLGDVAGGDLAQGSLRGRRADLGDDAVLAVHEEVREAFPDAGVFGFVLSQDLRRVGAVPLHQEPVEGAVFRV